MPTGLGLHQARAQLAVFGLSFTEIVVLLVIAIIVVGPRQLPTMLRTAGRFVGQARRWLFDVRAQSGIDEILRSEGLDKDIREFRSLVRGNMADALKLDLDMAPEAGQSEAKRAEPEAGAIATEVVGAQQEAREYPVEGCDSYGAVPEDVDPYVPVEATRTGEGER